MKYLYNTTVFILFFGLLSCNCDNNSERGRLLQQWMSSNGKLKALSTTAMINDLVFQVGGEYVDAMTLIIGELDPHSYKLVKGDDEKLSFADLIFYNGLGLEHGPSLQSYLKKQQKAIALGDKIKHDEPVQILYDNGQVDPHIWMDISLWAKSVAYIVDALSQKDPEHREIYQKNGDKLIQTMLQEHQALKQELAEVPQEKRYLVTSHDAFNYFARAYLADENEGVNGWQKRFAAPEGLAPDSQLSTTDIREIILHLKTYNIHVLFPESNISRDSIRKIVQAGNEHGLNVTIANASLYADAMGKPGSDGDTYLKMIRHNAKTIAFYLHRNGNNEPGSTL